MPGRPAPPAPGPATVRKRQLTCGSSAPLHPRRGSIPHWSGILWTIVVTLLSGLVEARPSRAVAIMTASHAPPVAWQGFSAKRGCLASHGIDRHGPWGFSGCCAHHSRWICQCPDHVGSSPDCVRHIIPVPHLPTSEAVRESVRLGAWGSKLQSVGSGECAHLSVTAAWPLLPVVGAQPDWQTDPPPASPTPGSHERASIATFLPRWTTDSMHAVSGWCSLLPPTSPLSSTTHTATRRLTRRPTSPAIPSPEGGCGRWNRRLF